jgi:hypothetical protein
MARQKKPADAVQFTRESAERIAGVIRAAELTPAAGSPLTFDKRFTDRLPKQVRAATFTGSWPIGSVKTVTFKYAPAVTANVSNLSWPITFNHVAPEDCIVGREGTSWWLVAPVLQTATAVFVTQTASQVVVTGVSASTATITSLSDVTVTASLNTSSCAITVGVTKTTASRNVVTGVTTSTATAVFITATATCSYLRLRVP